jgi:transcriptional regulator with XRE-family HTH domain
MDKSLGEIIRELRDEKNYSLREFAKEIGIRPSQLSDIERGGQYPTVERLQKIALLLGIDFDKLKGYEVRIEKRFRDLVRKDPEVGMLLRKVTENPELAKEFNKRYSKEE